MTAARQQLRATNRNEAPRSPPAGTKSSFQEPYSKPSRRSQDLSINPPAETSEQAMLPSTRCQRHDVADGFTARPHALRGVRLRRVRRWRQSAGTAAPMAQLPDLLLRRASKMTIIKGMSNSRPLRCEILLSLDARPGTTMGQGRPQISLCRVFDHQSQQTRASSVAASVMAPGHLQRTGWFFHGHLVKYG